MKNQRKRRVQNAECPMCGQVFSAQGLNGHMRWAHNALVSVKTISKRPKRVITQPKIPIPKRVPVLVKPRTMYDISAELAQWSSPSECCNTALRNAQALFGAIPELKNCFICAKCGEWYKLEWYVKDDNKVTAKLSEGEFVPKGASPAWHMKRLPLLSDEEVKRTLSEWGHPQN